MNSKCLQTGCYNPVLTIKGKGTGYCKQHQPPTDYWKMVWHPGTIREPIPGWDRTRKQILKRDKHTCTQCGTKPANQVDHIIPIWKGGSNLHTNLQTLCETCHQQKTIKEEKEKRKLKHTPKKKGNTTNPKGQVPPRGTTHCKGQHSSSKKRPKVEPKGVTPSTDSD